jgi:hypothetical protein
MQSQSEALHPFVEHCYHPTRIVLTLETDEEIITVPYQGRFALKLWFHLGLKP